MNDQNNICVYVEGDDKLISKMWQLGVGSDLVMIIINYNYLGYNYVLFCWVAFKVQNSCFQLI